MKKQLISMILASLAVGVAVAEPARGEGFSPEARQALREEMRAMDAQRFPKVKELALLELSFQESLLKKAQQCVTQATSMAALRACPGARPGPPRGDHRGDHRGKSPQPDALPLGD